MTVIKREAKEIKRPGSTKRPWKRTFQTRYADQQISGAKNRAGENFKRRELKGIIQQTASKTKKKRAQ